VKSGGIDERLEARQLDRGQPHSPTPSAKSSLTVAAGDIEVLFMK
jgi:hypothetical protein